MKMPQRPPPTDALWNDVMKDPEKLNVIFGVPGPSANGEYLHWDDLRNRKPPHGLSREEWWLGLKLKRQSSYRPLPLQDKDGSPFRFLTTDPIPERLHHIDLGAGGAIQMPEQITNPGTKDQYYVRSLIQEAITSSQLEGAATTREVAKEMLRTGRAPRDRSEQMILNNFLTMQRISKLTESLLTRDLVLEIHRLVTSKTLDDPTAAGRFRRPDERIDVGDDYSEVFHAPPPAEQLEDRMAAMCVFANGKTPPYFVHPAIRSIILHFWLAYDHPFKDGNGRTARALFYWSMLKHGFWLCEFISVSELILKAPVKYGQAFLYCETDENDLTYFILYHLEIIRKAVHNLHEYVKRKARQLQEIERELRGITVLNHRQRALISHALRHPHHRYTIESHQSGHNVVYQTARTDLLNLRDRGLVDGEKIGKTWYFTPADDLADRLRRL